MERVGGQVADLTRISKSLARRLVVDLAPEYLEMFMDLQKPSGWRKIAERISEIRKGLRLDNYVQLYEDERRLQACLALAVFGTPSTRDAM